MSRAGVSGSFPVLFQHAAISFVNTTQMLQIIFHLGEMGESHEQPNK